MLKRAIDCIRNQTYKNLEIIISNDCSPDPSIRPMLDEYAAKDKRIRLWHQPVDLQCYGNYNFVLKQATGKYFMYAQDDDMWDSRYIELLVDNLENHPENAFALSASAYVEPDGKIWQEFKFNNQSTIAFIFGEKIPFVWMGLWRMDKIRLFDQDPYETHGKDIIIAAETLLSFPFGYVDKLLYFKTIYHKKAQDYVKAKPWCHFEMYGHLLYRVAVSKHVKNKAWLFVLVPASCAALVRLYAAQVLFLLPVDHPIRKTVRTVFR
jgi:glycosyltransferase involved in cell wall biosynthesis